MSIQLTVMSLDFDSTAAPFTKVLEKDEITIGRLPGNDLVLDKPEISGYHASIRITASEGKEQLFIKDLGSSNGTMLENSPLRAQSEVALEGNQRIIIGNYLIKPSIVPSSTAKEATPAKEANASAEPFALQMGESSQTQATEAQQAPTSTALHIAEDISEQEESALQSFAFEERQQGNGSAIHFSTEETPSEPASEPASEPTPKKPSAVKAVEQESTDISDLSQECVITVTVGDSDVADLNFIAKQLLSLKGSVRHKGKPLADVAIDAGSIGSTFTDANGVFRFDKIVEGTTYALQCKKEGYLFDSLEGELDTDTTSLSVSARKLRTIAGRVEHNGTPLAGVVVDGGEQLGRTTTDAQGIYRFEDVPEDAEYTLRISKKDFVLAEQS